LKGAVYRRALKFERPVDDSLVEREKKSRKIMLLQRWVLSRSPCLPRPRERKNFAANHLFAPAGDRVRELDMNGNLAREFGTGTGLAQPGAAAFGPNGCLFVINSATATIFEFDGSGAKS